MELLAFRIAMVGDQVSPCTARTHRLFCLSFYPAICLLVLPLRLALHGQPQSLPLRWKEACRSAGLTFVASQTAGNKREHRLKLLVRISSSGVGVFHVKGWGPKSSICPSKPMESKFLVGMS